MPDGVAPSGTMRLIRTGSQPLLPISSSLMPNVIVWLLIDFVIYKRGHIFVEVIGCANVNVIHLKLSLADALNIFCLDST